MIAEISLNNLTGNETAHFLTFRTISFFKGLSCQSRAETFSGNRLRYANFVRLMSNHIETMFPHLQILRSSDMDDRISRSFTEAFSSLDRIEGDQGSLEMGGGGHGGQAEESQADDMAATAGCPRYR